MNKTKILLSFEYYDGDVYETQQGALNAAGLEDSMQGEHVNLVVFQLIDGKWAVAHLD